MSEVPNYPSINTGSEDTGIHLITIDLFGFICILEFFSGWTALHWACDAGEKEIVEMLIKNCRADPFVKNFSGSSPIHLAIAKDHKKVIECLLTYRPGLIQSTNDKNGWYPIHIAAYFKRVQCLAVLVKANADIMQLTEEKEGLPRYSTFHLAVDSQLKRKSVILRSPLEIQENLIRSISRSGKGDSNDHEENEVDEDDIRTRETVDFLLSRLPSKELVIADDFKHGTILHCLAAINHSEGVRQITQHPFNHPPDLPNSEGITPFMKALDLRSLESALELLDCEININRVHPISNLLPLQILLLKASSIHDVHLQIVDKLLAKGM